MTSKRSEGDHERRRELYDTTAGVVSPLDDLALTVALIDAGAPYDWDALPEVFRAPGGEFA